MSKTGVVFGLWAFGMDRKRQKNTGRARWCASLTMSAGAQGCTRTRLFRGGLARAGSHGLWHDRAALCALFSFRSFPDGPDFFPSGSHFFFMVRTTSQKTLKSMSVQDRHAFFLIQSGPSCHQTTCIDGKHLFTSDGSWTSFA